MSDCSLENISLSIFPLKRKAMLNFKNEKIYSERKPFILLDHVTSETLRTDLLGTLEVRVGTKDALERVTERASLANLLRPGKDNQHENYCLPPMPPMSFSSSSIGCLKAVMSRKVTKNRTTMSLSFLMGDM